METRKLKNGSEEEAELVAVITAALETLWKEKPIAAYELVQLCKDSEHKLFGMAGQDLASAGLLEPGNRVHDSIRNIVLSAVSGEGFEMTLGSPVASMKEAGA